MPWPVLKAKTMSNKDPSNSNPADLKHRLKLETGQLNWHELQTYFARGIVIVIGQGQDLIETALKLHGDEKTSIQAMIDEGTLIRASDKHALDWLDREPTFLSLVISPWLLVQEKAPH